MKRGHEEWNHPCVASDACAALASLDDAPELLQDEDAELPFRSALVCLEPSNSLAVLGEATVRVVQGVLDVFGYRATPTSPSFNVSSTIATSSLVLRAVAGGAPHGKLSPSVAIFVSNFASSRKIPAESVIVFSLCSLKSPVQKAVTSLRGFRDIFGGDVSADNIIISLKVFSEQNPKIIPLVPSPEGEAAAERFLELVRTQKSPILMVCGGKDAGKSSFARYVVNRVLSEHRDLYYIDSDVGQSEFLPPGCVGLHAVHQPLLGSPFSHLQKPIESFFLGSASPKSDPELYYRSFARTIQRFRYSTLRPFYSSTSIPHPFPIYSPLLWSLPSSCVSLTTALVLLIHSEIAVDHPRPLVVNTQGWVKGLGTLRVHASHPRLPAAAGPVAPGAAHARRAARRGGAARTQPARPRHGGHHGGCVAHSHSISCKNHFRY